MNIAKSSIPSSNSAPLKPQIKKRPTKFRRIIKKGDKIEKFEGEMFTLDLNTYIMIALGAFAIAYLLKGDRKLFSF